MSKATYRAPPNFIQKILKRYTYNQKINVIAGLLTFIIFFVLFQLISIQIHEIILTKTEIQGNKYKAAVYQLIDSISEHDIYSNRAFQGDNNATIKLNQLKEKIELEFNAIIQFSQNEKNELKHNLPIEQKIIYPSEIYSAWKELLINNESGINQTNQYGVIIDTLQVLLSQISDSYFLFYDPEIETHYLIKATVTSLPEEKDLTSRILIIGQRIIKQKSISPGEIYQLTTLVSSLISQSTTTEEEIKRSIVKEKNYQNSLDVKNLLTQPLANYTYAVHTFTDYTKKLILTSAASNPSFNLEEFFSLGTIVLQKNNVLYTAISDKIDHILDLRINRIKMERLKMLAVVFILLGIAMVGGYMVLYETKFFFRETYEAVVKFSEGELSFRAPKSYDKAFNAMSHVLNDLGDRIEKLIDQLQQSSVQLTTTTTQIAAAAKHQEGTVCQQEATVKEILVTAGEISSTAKEFAKTMNDVSISAEETSSLASHGRDGLNKMEQTMLHMVEASKNIASKLAVLNEKAGAITSVITTITKVADQTNLLSLNASIEAEKAGEHGKSFAVIAREIRRLADQTANATLDIEQMVSEMMSAVSEGVMGVDKFSEEIHTGVNQISTAIEQLSKIIEGVQRQTVRYENVNKGMQAQSFGAEQINESIMQLSDAAQETTNSIRQFHAAINQLTIATKEMQISVSKMKK